MRRALLLVIASALLPAAAWAGYPFDDDDTDLVQEQAPPPPAPAWPDQAVEDPAAAGYDPAAVQDPAQYAQYGIGYYGPHPIPYEYGSGFCNIEGPHSHEYVPFDDHLFRESGGYYYFIGDPYDFGWEAETSLYWYQGNHPIPLVNGGGYCFIPWPHRHHFAPVGMVGFNYVDNYYVYGGVWPSDYWYWRPLWAPYYTGYYRNWYYGRRYYAHRPPPAYRIAAPVRVAAPPGRVFVGAPPRAVRLAGPARVSVGAPAHFGAGARFGAPPAYVGPGAHPGVMRPGMAPPVGARPGFTAPPAFNRPAYTAPPAFNRPAYTPPPAFNRPAYTPPPAFNRPAFSAPRPSFTPSPSFNRPSFTPSPGFSRPSPSFSAPRPSPSFSAPRPSPSFHSAPSPSFRGGGGFGGGHRR